MKQQIQKSAHEAFLTATTDHERFVAALRDPISPWAQAEFTKQHDEWFNKASDAEKIERARLNPAMEWALPWIAKGIELDKASGDTRIEKALEPFMKSTVDQYAKAHADFDAKFAAFKAAHPTAPMALEAFLDTEDGHASRLACKTAHEARLAGPVAVYTKSLVDEIEKIGNEKAKIVEAFALQHNLDFVVARKRLEDVSPSYVALEKREVELSRDRLVRADKARVDAQRWMQAETAKAVQAEETEVAKMSEERRCKSMTPSARKLDDRIGEIMKARKLARPAATVWALDHDEVAKALHAVTREERGEWVQS